METEGASERKYGGFGDGPGSRRSQFKSPEVRLPRLAPANGRCNARLTRRRGYCTSTLTMANGRCRFHGGKSHPPFFDMMIKDQKSQYLPEGMYARFEHLNTNVLDNLEESIKMQQALETSIIERLDTGESAMAWASLENIANSYQERLMMLDPDEEDYFEQKCRSQDDMIDNVLTTIRNASKSFAIQSALRGEIQKAHEAQRKLTETLTKCRKEMQETYTEEEWNMMILVVMTAVKRHVEAAALGNFLRELQASGHVRAMEPVVMTAEKKRLGD